jgi:hypothetical protein
MLQHTVGVVDTTVHLTSDREESMSQQVLPIP